MAPETWVGLGAITGAVVQALGRVAWDRRKARNGNGNGHSHGGLDLSSEWRETRKDVHGLRDSFQEMKSRQALHEQRLEGVEELGQHLDAKLEAISKQITDLRIELAGRS